MRSHSIVLQVFTQEQAVSLILFACIYKNSCSIFVLRITSGPRVKFVDSKRFLTPTHPVVYATDRSKAVVQVFFLFCVVLWFILRSASCLVSCFFSLLSTVIALLGEEGGWFMCFLCIYLFILHALISVIFLFLLVSGVGCGI